MLGGIMNVESIEENDSENKAKATGVMLLNSAIDILELMVGSAVLYVYLYKIYESSISKGKIGEHPFGILFNSNVLCFSFVASILFLISTLCYRYVMKSSDRESVGAVVLKRLSKYFLLITCSMGTVYYINFWFVKYIDVEFKDILDNIGFVILFIILLLIAVWVNGLNYCASKKDVEMYASTMFKAKAILFCKGTILLILLCIPICLWIIFHTLLK